MLVWDLLVMSGISEGSDRIHVLVYNETRHESRVKLEAERRIEGKYRLEIPKKWEEERLHVYVAVSDEEGKMFSDSQYFGSGEREQRGFSMREEGEKRFGSVQSAIKEVSDCCSDGVEEGLRKGERAVLGEEKGFLGEGNGGFGEGKRCLEEGEGPLRE